MKAKRIAMGVFEYRGWDIELLRGEWCIRPLGEEKWVDSATYLRDAKEKVDEHLFPGWVVELAAECTPEEAESLNKKVN